MPIMRTPVLLALLVTLAAADAARAQYRPVVGEPHPDFVLPDIRTGEAVSLAQFRGKKVLLVHFASW